MKKTILTLALALTAITGLAASTSTPSQNSDLKSRIYYFVHYRTFFYTPVFYRPVVVAPVYPVYSYRYWYR